MSKLLDCATHGVKPWEGHVTCARDAGGCGAVYQTKDDKAPRFAPYDCPCGAPLMPHKPSDGFALWADPRLEPRKGFTARSICARCFEEHSVGPS